MVQKKNIINYKLDIYSRILKTNNIKKGKISKSEDLLNKKIRDIKKINKNSNKFILNLFNILSLKIKLENSKNKIKKYIFLNKKKQIKNGLKIYNNNLNEVFFKINNDKKKEFYKEIYFYK